MISHVHIGSNAFDRAFDFYTRLMELLGYPLKFVEPERPWAGWKPRDAERPLFIVGRPFDDGASAPGRGQMVALLARNRALVDRVYVEALQLGAVSDGAPGLRPQYHPNYYGAYFRDLDGNKICVVCHEPLA